ncbi:CDF family Co(II)/Ni(II) efflux transporter DmeF, partial [uncultured Bradyrhizobium sp.]
MPTASEIDRFAHDHVFLGSSHDENARRTLWVVALTAVMMVGEIIAGYLTGSMALLADGFHMATHAGALSVAAAAYAYAKRHARNPAYSFGTGKVGDLAGFASAMVLGLIALGIGVESVLRLFQPITVAFGEATIIAVVGLGVNIASAFLLSSGHHHHGHGPGHDHHHGHDHAHAHGSHGGDNNLRSAYVHVLADALTSVLAIAALLAGRYLGWVWMDPVMGIVGAVVIGTIAVLFANAVARTSKIRIDTAMAVSLTIFFGTGMLLVMWGGILWSGWFALAVVAALVPALLWMRWVTAQDDQRFRQIFVAAPDRSLTGLDLERRAFVARKRVEHGFKTGVRAIDIFSPLCL